MLASQQGLWSHTFKYKMFPDRQWNADWVKTLIKKTDTTGNRTTSRRQRGSGRPRSARTPANINEVEGLALSQEDKPQTTRGTKVTINE